MKGTKKLPHIITKVKIVATAGSGRLNGSNTGHRIGYTPSTSVQADYSISTGTPIMKPLVRKIAYGSELAPRNRIAPPIESMSFTCTNSEYTGIMLAVIGSPV